MIDGLNETTYWRDRAEAAEAALDRVRSITKEDLAFRYSLGGVGVDAVGIDEVFTFLTERMEGE